MTLSNIPTTSEQKTPSTFHPSYFILNYDGDGTDETKLHAIEYKVALTKNDTEDQIEDIKLVKKETNITTRDEIVEMLGSCLL